MFWAILVIIISVLAGTLLALVPKGQSAWLGPMRTFALAAALSVVVVHLLPEALSSVGPGAILSFLVGLFVPELLGKAGVVLWNARAEGGSGRGKNSRDLALEASYFGLLLHRVGDGVGLGAFTGELTLSAGNSGVVTALAAHAVPVVAIVVLSFDSARGRGSAIMRAVGLALASIVGVFIAHSVPLEAFQVANGWIAAFVGGMLLHVVTHDLGVQLPRTVSQRIWDLLAGAFGVLVSFMGQWMHPAHGSHDSEHAVHHFEGAFLEFAIETGPLLVLGLVAGALLTTLGARVPGSFFRSRGPVLDAARGTLIGAPLPLCSCSVLPISAALKARGAAPALVVSFLLSTPELGVETFALSVRFLGWEMAWMRLFGALIVAFGTALAVALYLGRTGSSEADAPEELLAAGGEGPFLKRVLHAFDELFHHIGAWMILGVVAAALVEVAIAPEAFDQVRGFPAQFLVITLIAIPSYVCAPSATPLAAVLLAKGLSPGAVLVGLLLGPATNIATVVFLRRWFGGKAAALGLVVVTALAWVLGLLADQFLPGTGSPVATVHAHEHSALWKFAAAISGLILLRALFKAGVRGFLVTLQGEHGHSHGDETPAAEGDGHSHGGHAHHAHGHEPHGHAHGAHDDHGHAHGSHEGHSHADSHDDHGHQPPKDRS